MKLVFSSFNKMTKLTTPLIFVLSVLVSSYGQYTADWSSLDSRPLPQWYDDSKVGIFLHWGVFSVPSFGSEWFWQNWKGYQNQDYVDFMNQNYPPGFTYQDFASQFTAEFYDPDYWADLFAAAGAKYVVLTSKHHEGYTLWPSKYSFSWNAMDVGPSRDILGDLAGSIRARTNLHFGIYHSLYEWFNPLYLQDKNAEFQTNDFVKFKTMPELYEITNLYSPEVIWSDGEWEAEDWYWNSTVFLAWLFNESPVKDTVVVNDRWGMSAVCTHGSFYTCTDRYNPGVLQAHKWENCMTIDKLSWGYRRNAVISDYMTIEELLKEIITTVSCGGNILVNTGPTPDGRIDPIMEERLRQMGSWLALNGEAIYSSTPWIFQNDTLTPGVWYTVNNNAVYSTVLSWPANEVLTLGSVTDNEILTATNVTMLGYSGELATTMGPLGLEITFPPMSQVTAKWSWVLKIEGLATSKDKTKNQCT